MGEMNIANYPDIYLYGMTVLSTIHLLEGKYPEPDTYGEIKQSHIIPGGETANAAIILSKLGYKTRIDGPFLGLRTREEVLKFCDIYNIDARGLYFDESFEGVQDLVLIDGDSRTIFGKFGNLFSSKMKRWTASDREAIKKAKIVSIDPFFKEESLQAAKYCVEEGKKYITIDCEVESFLHTNSAATVISNEFICNKYPNIDVADLFGRYANASKGLVIFTFGAKEIFYGRCGKMNIFHPFKIKPKSTLGAGDTFRAGVIYGVLNNMNDEDIVRFAASTAACVCSRFPMALTPPQDWTRLLK